MSDIIQIIALELKVRPEQVSAAVDLLDGGATVPFIARYRKEQTNGLDDIELRELQIRLEYLRELADRRITVLKAIEEQGKLTPALQNSIAKVQTKQELEDIYLPFKLKRRTKAQMATEAGLELLADIIIANPNLNPTEQAQAFVIPFVEVAAGEDKKPDFSNTTLVLDGVREIL